ncbi:MAG TPA: exo-alpha-sialidase, partial [Candidatus Latescibacteria bacterium]|nr:exo-alpha-sialidase [Candidatus Latescibacterota bacterium]
MPVEKFTISRDDKVYECFPHLCRTRAGRIILTYRESNGHVASDFCRLVVRFSDDAGHSWSDRLVVRDEDRSSGVMRSWNCPKIQQLEDGRILLLCDAYNYPPGEWGVENEAEVVFWFSEDDGRSFSDPQLTSVRGICPDQVTEIEDGRWILPTNMRHSAAANLFQALTVSGDSGKTWEEPYPLYNSPDRELDEASIVKMPAGELVSYQREDRGGPLQKMISCDGGASWEGPFDTLNPAAIGMPIAGLTRDGFVLVTSRYGIPSRWRVDMSAQTWQQRIDKRGIVIPKVEGNEANRRFVASVERGPYVMETENEIVMGMGGSSVHTFAFIEPIQSALSADKAEQKGLLLLLLLNTLHLPFKHS